MKPRTYTELEDMGIISAFRDDTILYIITKGGLMWRYISSSKHFELYKTL